MAMGLAINVKIKHFYPSILKLNFIQKCGLRFLLLTTPMGIVYQLITKQKREQLNFEIDIIHIKLRKLGREGSLPRTITTTKTTRADTKLSTNTRAMNEEGTDGRVR